VHTLSQIESIGALSGASEAASAEYKENGMGTPIAEYAEDGPYHCQDCWFLKSREPKSEARGSCNEPHMLIDPKTIKIRDMGGKVIAASVHKEFGCCRFVDPVKPGAREDNFVFAKNPEEEAEEHDQSWQESAVAGMLSK
jgi:hypothetical protein